MAFGLLRRRPRQDPEHADRIKAWVRAEVGCDEDTNLSVNEIVCHDPGCPGTETVVLVMPKGERTWALKVAAAMADVTAADVAAALEAAVAAGAAAPRKGRP